ncbi:MAG: galactokinase [Phycisphaerae bacterium]
MASDVLDDPAVVTLLRRLREERLASFDPARPLRLSRSPGRLDVMGGIADYTGSLVCEWPLAAAAAVATQPRPDRQVQVFSFNLFDENRPYTFAMPLDRLAGSSYEQLRAGFNAIEANQTPRAWAGYVVGCLYVLHAEGLLDLTAMQGLNVAVWSTVPGGAGVSSSAALEVASMLNFLDAAGLGERPDAMRLAAMCQTVENRVVGAPCGIMDQVASAAGQAGALLTMRCQPHDLQPPTPLPAGVQVVGINSNVKHAVGGGAYGRTRCAAFMGQTIIQAQMQAMARAAGKIMAADPTHGYLANLPLEDYKRFFRSYLPEEIGGEAFLSAYGPTADTATAVDPKTTYHVQGATDHHVWESHRVAEFVRHLHDAAATTNDPAARKLALDKAGHLMYASHISYTRDARLGADECDVLVDLVRANEPAGLYGAKITGGGSGGTVAVLCDSTPQAADALSHVLTEYTTRTTLTGELITGTSHGGWFTGTEVVGLPVASTD